MYKYLQVIGFRPARPGSNGKKLYVIHNPDGSPRWIWNADNPEPDFLRFYTITGFRARVFALAIVLLFRLKWQHWFLWKYKLDVEADTAHVLYPFISKHFALFTGTVGPNRKLVLFAQNQFIKIALNENTAQSIEGEKKTLLELHELPNVRAPKATSLANGILALTDMGTHAVRCHAFTDVHARALKTLYTRQVITKGNFGTTKIFQKSIDKLATGPGVQSPKMPQFLREKLEILAHSLKNEQMFSTWAHGDFTPWNCFVAEQKIHLYDFELSCSQMPFGFDAFHFVLQQGILAERLTWSAIKPQMRAAFDLLQKETGLDGADYDTCLKAYLLVNIAYYWQVYSQQEKWHPQIMWLLNTWNDALSDLLAPLETPRKLIIGDVFDFLQHLPYAAVKFPNIHPKALSEYTDIDLLMQKSTAIALFAYLQNHSAVQKIGVQQQSNMMTLRVLLHDGSLLALDLIWQLRRKALVFMSLAEALEQAVLNEFGIKTLSAAHTQSYLKYFYGLNNSAIPIHYAVCFENGKPAAENHIELKKQIAQIPDNKGIKNLYNHINYLLDTLKKPFRQRGIVITFSGVDGAGKSTIIEHTKKELEKKWRKRVVVIRHRPSLLPILSAFTQGKKKAEQKAASTLPRQGSNKNLISSLLRFAYYYSDYLLGQFYVYARYVMHGHIVLYDRYYFDFINDPLRSNIRLPRWLTKAGYQLLLRAPLNFFLYADPDTILGRKKELDAQAITQLTNDYLSLFKALDKHSPGRYFSVENLQLADTVHFITTQTRSHLI